ncbi:unnamed protein product, partial [Ectocarpus fasciculatus]
LHTNIFQGSGRPFPVYNDLLRASSDHCAPFVAPLSLCAFPTRIDRNSGQRINTVEAVNGRFNHAKTQHPKNTQNWASKACTVHSNVCSYQLSLLPESSLDVPSLILPLACIL